METREYAEVEPQDVLVLNLLTLGYSLDATRVAAVREQEARVEPFVALYAVEHGAALGQVGAMSTTVETTDGPERFGALWGVATHPDHMGRGVASHLIGEVHERFRAQGLRHAFLTTGRGLAAHRVYKRLGYFDLAAFDQFIAPPAGLGDAAPRTGAEPDQRVFGPGIEDLIWAQSQPSDAETVYALYRSATAGMLGFVHRDRGFLQGAAALGDLSWERLRLLRERGEPVGYAITSRRPKLVYVPELQVLPRIPLADALAATRRMAPEAFVVYQSCNSMRDRTALREAGFVLGSSGPGVVMAASIDGPADEDGLRRRLGIGCGRFAFGYLDST